ncbi:MAG: YARHG domain-containing protein [Fulvivirga sp.]|uniref:YARHG domain-containing protein n=1 Tax=Fulvivirga sp. TaxID=1931237 RepID=UPI0032EE71B3
MKKIISLLIICLLVSCGTDKKEQKATELKELSASELQDKSIDELRIIRNEIFARKGYIFNSEDLQKHFSAFDWYQPQYENVDSLLTDLDKKNIQTILELENRRKNEIERRIINISDKELAHYKNAYDSAEKWDKQFMNKMFQTIEQFKGRPADTTVLTVGNIDGIGKLDTVTTQVYVLDDTVYVESNWTRNGELLWSDKIKTPYLQINNDDIFAYDLRHPWVTFTIAVNYGAPELSKRADYSGIDRETALKMAKWYIERKNLEISEEEYTQYFDSFNGQLFIFGEPEIWHELLQWYEPKKVFILYYAP